MEFDDYQKHTASTAIYPDNGQRTDDAITYCVLGAVGEAGELANTWKKALRDGDRQLAIEKLRYELGDTLWYLSQLATELGMPLDRVAETNLEKLRDRKIRNQLRGSGDYR